MYRYVFCVCLLLTALTMTPTDAAASRKEKLPFKVSHIEKSTSARYIGPGLIKEDTNVALKTLSKLSISKSDQCTQIYGCLNCTWARVCAPNSNGTLVEVSRSACPASRPFCDAKSGSCVPDIQPDCLKPIATNVTCFKKEGYFPHPTDCRKFVYCSNYASYLFQCDESLVYHASSQGCENYYCYTINCVINDGRKVQHPLSNKYYTYCSGGISVGFDSCLGNDFLNTTSQLCEPSCSYEGLIRDTSDCTQYYKCSYVWINNYRFMTRKRLSCPTGFSFSPEEFQCVKGIPEKGCVQS